MIRANGFALTAFWKRSIRRFWMKSRMIGGELERPYVLELPTKQVSIRLPVTDLELAKRLAKRKGIPKYQSYIKALLHEALVKEASQT
jgi:hypothetical protein